MDSPYPSPLPLSGKSFFRKPLVEIGGMPHPLTESSLRISVLTIKDFEFGTLPWHLVIRVKFGTCVQNWDFFGTKIRDLKRKHTTLLIYLLDA